MRGEQRGLSGRERLAEGSGCYLIFRSFSDQVYNPVLICRTWAEAARFVKPFGSLGNSVFVGVPNLTDGRVVCNSAGVDWPEAEN